MAFLKGANLGATLKRSGHVVSEKAEFLEAPSLQEQRCREVVETYCEIDERLTNSGRQVPPEVVAQLCSLALRLILVRP
jgi:hypothetical protein